MAERYIELELYVLPQHYRIGKKVGSTKEYIPDRREPHLRTVWATYVADGDTVDTLGASLAASLDGIYTSDA